MHRLTKAQLESVLSYDPDTNTFQWLIRKRGIRQGPIKVRRSRYITIDGRKHATLDLAHLWTHGTYPEPRRVQRSDMSDVTGVLKHHGK